MGTEQKFNLSKELIGHPQGLHGQPGHFMTTLTATGKDAASIGALEDMNQSALSMSQAMLHNNTSYYGTKDLIDEIDTRDGRVGTVAKSRGRQDVDNDAAN